VDLEDPMNIVESDLPPVRLLTAHVPADLETMSVERLIAFAQSMGRLNVQLTDAFNQMIRSAERYGSAMSAIVEEYASLAERLEADEQAAAKQASENRAASGFDHDAAEADALDARR
jgi:hypothetical protein